jgi:hypothetical protein
VKPAVAALFLCAIAARPLPALAQFDPCGLAARLRASMTISQALLALGNRPTSTDETSCRAQQTGEPFTCRIWNYATEFEQLQIFFRYNEPQQRWVVYGWRL